MADKINLAVIFGGQSGEHEVSLSSAKAVLSALDKKKYSIIPIAITKKGTWLVGSLGEEYLKRHAEKAGKEGAISIAESESLAKENNIGSSLTQFFIGNEQAQIDLVFPLIHGPYGEDGRLQGLLDMIGIPYVFSGILAHAIGMNKPIAKIIANQAGVPVVKDIVLRKGEPYSVKAIIDSMTLPIIVKPAELGSSVGVSIGRSEEEINCVINEAFSYGHEVIIEEFIKGREFTVTVMEDGDPLSLAITEIIPIVSEFYDYKAKYEVGGSKHVCPAELPEPAARQLQKFAVDTFNAIGCYDLARTDFIWDEKNNQFYFIDINTAEISVK